MSKQLKRLEAIQKLVEEVIAYEEDRVEPIPGEPAWMRYAQKEIGQKEVKGREHNPRIVEYLQTTTLGKRPAGKRDETPWCSAYVNWCMAQAGIEGTDSAMARSWLGWGVELEGPRYGCVAVLKRGKAPSGHIGFCTGGSGLYLIRVLGGNQSDSVCIKSYKRADVIGYRWPEGVPL